MSLPKKVIEAIKSGKIEIIRAYLHTAAKDGYYDKLNACDSDGLTMLHHAVAKKQNGVVAFLLRADANACLGDKKYHNTPLHYAAMYNNAEAAQLLLDNHALIHARNKAGDTALHLAALNGAADVIKLLLSRNAGINDVNNNGRTALHMLCCADNLSRELTQSIARDLIKHGADIDLTITVYTSNYYSSSYSIFNLSEYAQYRKAPAVAEVVNETRRIRAEQQKTLLAQQEQKQNALQAQVELLKGEVCRLNGVVDTLSTDKGTPISLLFFTQKTTPPPATAPQPQSSSTKTLGQ